MIPRGKNSMKCSKCSFENLTAYAYCKRCGAKLLASEDALSATMPFYRPKPDLSIGSILALRYQIIEEIGRGGMGTVYKVLDREIKEKIAIKVLKPEISSDEKTIERFRNELKLARKISHQNVCRMYDIVKERGLYFITMEYISGEDLKSTIIRLEQVSVGKTLLIAKQICKGLAEAHRLGVVHRDLKPHNIIIDREGEVRIMDFGIALSRRTAGITEAGVMIGTPEYMSPEQAAGKELDNRSDIYSLGVIMFELLTGSVPFKADKPLDVAMMQKTETPPDPRSINPQIPKELSALILKCLEKDRNKRFSNCEDVIAEISRMEKGHPTTEKLLPDPKKQWSVAIPQSRLTKLILPVASLAAVIILIGVYLLFLRPTDNNGNKMTIVNKDNKVSEDNKVSDTDNKPPPMGVLSISSVPSGANIYVDEKLFKKLTPASLDLPSGSYRIRVSYPDCEDVNDDVQIGAGEKISREYTMKQYYFIDIITEPPEAAVRIDGELQGRTPTTVKLTKSSCQLRLDKGRGWEPHEEPLSLKPGQNPALMVALRRQQAKLSIVSNPPGALIYVDGELWGSAPQEKYIMSGSHKVRLEKEGYRPEDVSLSLSANLNRIITLTKIPDATVIISAVHYAEVYIDSVYIGSAPPRITRTIEEGKHVIEFQSRDKTKKYQVELVIKAGEKKKVHMNMETGKPTITDE
jgi:serine/threonine protein kinase